MSEYRNTEIFAVEAKADLPMDDIYLDHRGWDHIETGHRSVSMITQLLVNSAAENPTRIYQTLSHPNRFLVESSHVQSKSGKYMNLVVERDNARGRIITASPRPAKIGGACVWEWESAVYTSYDKSSDIFYMSKGPSIDTYAIDDEETDRIWLRYSDDDDNKPVGTTVFDFRSFWASRKDELVSKISAFLSLSHSDVRLRLEGFMR